MSETLAIAAEVVMLEVELKSMLGVGVTPELIDKKAAILDDITSKGEAGQ